MFVQGSLEQGKMVVGWFQNVGDIRYKPHVFVEVMPFNCESGEPHFRQRYWVEMRVLDLIPACTLVIGNTLPTNLRKAVSERCTMKSRQSTGPYIARVYYFFVWSFQDVLRWRMVPPLDVQCGSYELL